MNKIDKTQNPSKSFLKNIGKNKYFNLQTFQISEFFIQLLHFC